MARHENTSTANSTAQEQENKSESESATHQPGIMLRQRGSGFAGMSALQSAGGRASGREDAGHAHLSTIPLKRGKSDGGNERCCADGQEERMKTRGGLEQRAPGTDSRSVTPLGSPSHALVPPSQYPPSRPSELLWSAVIQSSLLLPRVKPTSCLPTQNSTPRGPRIAPESPPVTDRYSVDTALFLDAPRRRGIFYMIYLRYS
ncbi:hypothetical protein DFH09DRAFT_1094609 [Mycena vulgaris]|nr:hypothetical protein DFH09DRAFT_1094609 [Mycena vulgaris]